MAKELRKYHFNSSRITKTPLENWSINSAKNIGFIPRFKQWISRSSEILYSSSEEREILRCWEILLESVASVRQDEIWDDEIWETYPFPAFSSQEEIINFVNTVDEVAYFNGSYEQNHVMLAASERAIKWLAEGGYKSNPVGKPIHKVGMLLAYHFFEKEGATNLQKFIIQQRMLAELSKYVFDHPLKTKIFSRDDKFIEGISHTKHIKIDNKFIGTLILMEEREVTFEYRNKMIQTGRIVTPTPKELFYIHGKKMFEKLSSEQQQLIKENLLKANNKVIDDFFDDI